MADSGTMQIGDILLDISPEQILMDRQSVNHFWKTLRTRSSIKMKSGFSSLQVVLNRICFTDDIDPVSGLSGYDKLRYIISQVRAMPFLWIDNDYLRNTLLSGDRSQAMVFAVHSLEITKDLDSSNAIYINLVLEWFNYLPYLRDFTFKKDIWLPTQVKNPRDSLAFKRLYKAEQHRGNYDQVVSALDGNLTMRFTEYAQIRVRDYQKLQQEANALKALRNELASFGENTDDFFNNISNSLAKNLGDDRVAASILVGDIFGDTTSVTADSVNLHNTVVNTLNKTLDPNSLNSKYGIVLNADQWRVTLLKNGRPINVKSVPYAIKPNSNSSEFNADDLLMVERDRVLDFGNSGLIVQGISIGFSHHLARIPMAGHPYPTFQHLGGMDTTVDISIATVSDDAVKQLSAFYTVIEDQAHKFRTVPGGQRNIRVNNDIINRISGLQEFIPDKLNIQTVPGSPGTSQIFLTLIDNPLTSSTTEELKPGQGFSTSHDIRLQIVNILNKSIRFQPSNFITDTNVLGRNPTVKKRQESVLRKDQGALGAVFGSDVKYNIYEYTGPRGLEHTVFRKLTEEYASNLGKFLENILGEIQNYLTRRMGGDELSDIIAILYRVNNLDIIGIDKIKQDIQPLLNKNPKINKGLKNSGVLSSFNTLNELKSELVSSEENNRKEKTANTTLSTLTNGINSDIKGKVIKGLLDIHFSKWIDFIIPFLDNNLSLFLDLPQFESLLSVITSQALQGGSDCYPDLPLRQVLIDLQKEGNKGLASLNEILRKKGLLTQGISASSLIQPDYFVFNPVVDNLRDLIPSQQINRAIESIKSSQSSKMFEAEESWFEGVYRSDIMGAQKYDESNRKRVDPSLDPTYWEENQHLNTKVSSTFAPNDLSGDFPGSIKTESSGGNPIMTPAIVPGDKNDKWLSTSRNEKSPITLVASENVNKVQHRLGLHALDFLPERSYSSLPLSKDKNKRPSFIYPIGPGYVITSRQGQRKPPNTKDGKKGSGNHPGVDIAYPGSTKDQARAYTLGQPVYAAADGKIIRIQKISTGYGHNITIEHTGDFKTRYCHLNPDPVFDKFYNAINSMGEFLNASREIINRTLTVTQGQRIGSIGNTGNSSGPHLHFEILRANQHIDPIPLLDGTAEKSQGPISGVNPQNENILTKSLDQFTKEMTTDGQGGGLIRAFPAYRLYFIESDSGERRHYAFDDFFSYNAVKDITLIRNSKIASDLCVIELTNTSGVLSNRKFQNDADVEKSRDAKGNIIYEQIDTASDRSKANTAQENPMASIMLQTGVQIQLRLGFSNNPDDLEQVFNGIITDINFSEGSDLITIVCQSFAIELVAKVQGKVKESGGWFSDAGRTGAVLEELMAFPEVVHFGRWEPLGAFGANSARHLLRDDWRKNPTPQDDNIFAPPGSGIFSIPKIKNVKYIMYKTNIWEVFQEMTLRHPGYVALPVPYQGKYGPRMTMFFGVPDQLYFARDPTVREENIQQTIGEFIKGDLDRFDSRAVDLDNIMDGNNSLRFTGEEILAAEQSGAIKIDEQQRKGWLKNVLTSYAKDKGFIKSFRSYHVITSAMHIIHNNISNSAHNTFNVATVQYSNNNPGIDKELAEVKFNDIDTFTLDVDGGLQDEDKREMLGQFPNCVGNEMARRYALSLLWRSMKQGYRGSITIIGNPKIKPIDIIYIFDEYNDMYGPIEVEQVIHRFNGESGFTTEITPNMVVHVNQASTMASSDAVGLVAEQALKSINMPSLASIVHNSGSLQKAIEATAGAEGIKGVASGIASIGLATLGMGSSAIASMFFRQAPDSGGVGAFIWRKFATRTQFAHPLRYSPLVIGNIPLSGGVPTKTLDCGFIQSIGNWFKDSSQAGRLYLEDTWASINVWPRHTQGDLLATVLGKANR